MAVKPIPDGYHTATPYLIVRDAAGAIEFYQKAFAATELLRMAAPGGKLGHAEIRIGDSAIMLADEHPEMGVRGPQSIGGAAVSILLYVADVDALFGQAVAAPRNIRREQIAQSAVRMIGSNWKVRSVLECISRS